MKIAKQIFFDDNIQEIMLTNKKPWDLINWVNKCKLTATEAINVIKRKYGQTLVGLGLRYRQ